MQSAPGELFNAARPSERVLEDEGCSTPRNAARGGETINEGTPATLKRLFASFQGDEDDVLNCLGFGVSPLTAAAAGGGATPLEHMVAQSGLPAAAPAVGGQPAAPAAERAVVSPLFPYQHIPSPSITPPPAAAAAWVDPSLFAAEAPAAAAAASPSRQFFGMGVLCPELPLPPQISGAMQPAQQLTEAAASQQLVVAYGELLSKYRSVLEADVLGCQSVVNADPLLYLYLVDRPAIHDLLFSLYSMSDAEGLFRTSAGPNLLLDQGAGGIFESHKAARVAFTHVNNTIAFLPLRPDLNNK